MYCSSFIFLVIFCVILNCGVNLYVLVGRKEKVVFEKYLGDKYFVFFRFVVLLKFILYIFIWFVFKLSL